MKKTPILKFIDFSFFYKKGQVDSRALTNISFDVYPQTITAIIGPSGCGKSTLLFAINRLHELDNNVASVEGQLLFHNQGVYGREMDVVKLRKKIGLVFQKPAPFPMSIYENIVFALKIHGQRDQQKLNQIVEKSLKQVNLWKEVKDRLYTSALLLSGGQQQRLCLARCLANEPEIILMDEPTSSLDPISKTKIENLIFSLKNKYTIILVTHSLSQASEVSDYVVFLRDGKLIENGKTKHVFTQPKNKATLKYITGKFE